MSGLVPGIHVLSDRTTRRSLDGRDKPGHDERQGEAALRKRIWRELTIAIGIALAFLPAAQAQTIPGALPESAKALSQGEWPAYAGTYAAARYSPLTQINRDNAKNLRVAWRWKSPDMAIKEANPKIGPTRANDA